MIRVVIAGIGLALMVGGLLLGLSFGGGLLGPAFWMIVTGAALLVVAFIEVMRYRSEAAEKLRAEPGRGGGETGDLERRFRPTEEVFLDPTSGHRMRVYADARTGERRYVAEG